MSFLDTAKHIWNSGGRDFLQSLTKGVTKRIAAVKIEEQFNKIIHRYIINNAITLGIFVVALLVSLLSVGISSVLILASLVWTIIRIVPKVVVFIPYFIPAIVAAKETLKKRGEDTFGNLLVYFVIGIVSKTHPATFGAITRGFNLLDSKFGIKGIFDWLPDADELIGYVWAYLGKQVLIFLASAGLYVIVINFIAKALLLEHFIGIGRMKIYIAPFALAIDFLFGTNIMQWVME
jgi:hypothetical protein